MQPPPARSQAFDATRSGWLGRRVNTIPLGLHGLLSDFRLLELPLRRRSVGGHRLAVSDARVALPNFYDVAVRIANIAARLTVLGLGLRDELGSSTSPQFIARLNICNADIHEAAD
jgi:hypothetical protein